jgi:hypothetical protein
MINEDSAQKLRRVDLRSGLSQVLASSENYPTSHLISESHFMRCQVFVCAQMYWEFSVAVRQRRLDKNSPNARADCRDATRELKSKLLIVEDIPDSKTFNHVFLVLLSNFS